MIQEKLWNNQFPPEFHKTCAFFAKMKKPISDLFQKAKFEQRHGLWKIKKLVEMLFFFF